MAITSKISILALCVLLMGGTAVAQEEHESVFKLSINDGASDDDVVIEINSKDQDFRLHDLQLGESRALTTTDGRPVTVTRAEESFEFNVDGRTVSMPLMPHDEHPPQHGGPRHKEVHIIRKMEAGHAGDPDAVMIISGETLDDATRASITSALAAAGLNNVEFIESGDAMAAHGGPRPPGTKDVRIIRKKVRVTN